MERITADGLQSEVYVPITPKPVWAPVTKPLREMVVALATAAGVHRKDDVKFNLSGDCTWRKVSNDSRHEDLMVTHGGYDNSDVNKDINCMFPIDRINELAEAGFIKGVVDYHATFMGGGGIVDTFEHQTGPEIAQFLKEQGADAVLLTAG